VLFENWLNSSGQVCCLFRSRLDRRRMQSRILLCARIFRRQVCAPFASFGEPNSNRLFPASHPSAFPAFPERNVPCSLRRIALLTDLPAAFPYFGMVASLSSQLSSNATASELGRRCVTSCKAPSKSMYVPPTCRAYTMYRIANRAHSQ
jgi:hypothetical protein